jgi:hypothetical protein
MDSSNIAPKKLNPHAAKTKQPSNRTSTAHYPEMA